MQQGRRLSRSLSRDRHGFVLPLALMVFVVLGALAAALVAVGSSEVQVAGNHLHGVQARFMAEAGLEQIFNTLRTTPGLVATAPSSLPADPQLSGALGTTGSYTVQYQATGTGANTVRVVSTGASAIGGSQKVLRATMTTAFLSNYAILADEVELDNTARAEGTLGAVHGNDETRLKGTQTFVAQTATSAGNTCEHCTENVGVPAGSGANKSTRTIPVANPMDFLAMADFVLGDGETVVHGITVPKNQILQTSNDQLFSEGDAPFTGWENKPGGEWKFTGTTTPPDGTYYARKTIEIHSSPGTEENPWRATFVAGADSQEGKVDINNHATIASYLQDVLIIANGDVKLKNTGVLTGAIVATGGNNLNVELDTSVQLTGNIITTGKAKLKSSAKVTYNNKTVTPLTGPLQILSWGP